MASDSRPSEALLAGLGARVHLFAHPDDRTALRAVFAETLECDVLERDFGLDHPVLLVRFPDGSAFSVEFSTRASRGPGRDEVRDDTVLLGAWVEFRTPDVDAAQERLRAAGVPEFRHQGSPHPYFVAPGGQVFRLLDVAYQGP